MNKHLKIFFTGFLLLGLSIGAYAQAISASAQEDLSPHWNGVWNAEGTLFTIAVNVTDDVMQVTKIETMGFEWENEDGVVNGNIATVAVTYAGVTGTIQVELIDPNTAVAFAATCLPDYMVVCALSKNLQAVFRRVEPDQEISDFHE